MDRLLPDIPLPPYSYVPGKFPHPERDDDGHGGDADIFHADSFNPARWSSCRAYLRAIDLFNSGYYWESHECWEAIWHAVGRRGTVADFLKALIKLAAAGVKAREGRPDGVQRHARRARELLQEISAHADGNDMFGGMNLAHLLNCAESLVANPGEFVNDADDAVLIVLPLELRLEYEL